MTRSAKSGPGCNRRDQYMSRLGLYHPLTEEEIETAINQRVQAGQCRLIERATHGLFTWQGDRLVAGPGHRRRKRGPWTNPYEKLLQPASLESR